MVAQRGPQRAEDGHGGQYDAAAHFCGFCMRGRVQVPSGDQLDGPASKFQVAPNRLPVAGSSNNYNWKLAQTSHSSGMNVALADGSARAINGNISGATWWAVCTTDAGDLPGTDW